MSSQTLDLTKTAPASPKARVGGYVILARLADKARADFLGGNIGEYHTDCPLDHMLLDWKGVEYAGVKKAIVDGADDEKIAALINSEGTAKTPDEIKAWSDSMEKMNPYFNPERKEWFAGECEKAGLDPAKTTLFDWLDATDTPSQS